MMIFVILLLLYPLSLTHSLSTMLSGTIVCSNSRRIATQSFNFVDGDLVESFLDLKPEHQNKVLQIIHGMAEAKVPLTISGDTKEDEECCCDGGTNNMEGIGSWKAMTQLSVEGLSQAIESMVRQH